MKLRSLDGDFTVCKVPDYSQVNLDAEFCFAGTTDEERSVVCPTACAPGNATERADGWRGFRIEGVLDFSLIGVLAKISALLAAEEVGIFVVSTFNTDYVFVKKEDERKALDALIRAGYEF